MEALYMQPFEEKIKEQEAGRTQASCLNGSTTDEETDEDTEPEPPTVIRRKVSFADAFGLDLVSVKEFENVEAKESEVKHPLEEFYMTCLFAVPSCPEELEQRLQAQMVELESIELLPGTSTLRGIIRVVNLCFCKSVYARMTLDCWTSYFDLMAEYVPGSSDRKTDRFTFQYTLMPPFEKEGIRLEFCLRYETSKGTFWANNNEMNYVLFCHQKGQVQEQGPHMQDESCSHRGKRSCLKANRRGSAQEKALETCYISTALAAEEATTEDIKTRDRATVQYDKEHNLLGDSRKSRHRATRLARAQECLARRRQHALKAYSHDSGDGRELPQPLPSPWGHSVGFLHGRQKKQPKESPQVLTYHQIPLLTLDWNNDKIQQWGAADVDDIWTGGAKIPLSKESVESIDDTPSANDMWESFRNGTDGSHDKETSVCNVWQSFLNGTDHSSVPESEWLQTAASVSPSNDKEPKPQYALSSQKNEFEVGMDPPTILHAHTSAACQLLSDACQTSLAFAALNTEDHQPAEACVSSQKVDNTAMQDASQRSQTNWVTDTPQEFSPVGATPVSEGSVDSSTECHEHAMWERESERIIGRAEGIGETDLVTSSGESETTDLTASAETQNASAVDRISQGARLGKGLSSSREGEVTGMTHNATDDTLTFQGNIKQGTKDGERFVFSLTRQAEEKGIMNKCTANRASTEEEVFRPEKTEGCEISQRYADEKQREEFRLNQNRENPLLENKSDENEIRPEQPRSDEINPKQMCEDNFKESQMRACKFKMDDSQNKDVVSNTKVEASSCTTSEDTERLIAADVEIELLNEEATQLNSSQQRQDESIMAQVHKLKSSPIKAKEELPNQEKVARALEIGGYALVSNQTEEGITIMKEEQKVNPSFQTGQTDPREVTEDDPNALQDTVEQNWAHSSDDMKSQKEVIGNDTTTEEVMARESTEEEHNLAQLQHQPEVLERTEEDESQRDKDERVSIGKLEIEAQGELMGNVENPRGERRNAPAEWTEQELSAEGEGSPCVECKKLSEETKDPITAEVLEVMESGFEGMLVERFGEDLVKRIWEEVFSLKVDCSCDTNIVERQEGTLRVIPDSTHNCPILFEKDSNDDFDSGIFSLMDLPTDPKFSTRQDQPLETTGNDCVPEELSHSLLAEQANLSSEDPQARTDLNSGIEQLQDLKHSWPSSTEPAQSSSTDRENYTKLRKRSVSCQEPFKQTEDCSVARRDSFNQLPHPTQRVPSPSSEKLKESDRLTWWSMLYLLAHVTRLLICIVLVAGFFYVVFLYDFPSFFALNIFSVCCWFSMWKKHRDWTNKGAVG